MANHVVPFAGTQNEATQSLLGHCAVQLGLLAHAGTLGNSSFAVNQMRYIT